MKPTYRMSKRQIWLSFWLAWAVILYLIWRGANGSDQAVSLAGTVVPSMMLLIAALLGIHRFAGSMDFAAVQNSASPVQPLPLGFDARDDPNPATGETP
ncbi:NAD(P)+ transhydrogenase beta chain [Agrobacterium larrymoorei]|uniref:Cytosine/uracil/thiamine/allantoin permease n=1 Tax=Agrobacterium larrymoorei TaxID=160699 RepID=A0ABU0UKC6_9HYPH|nr:NAD(P)+ transhydrogenase beta chain [Agrobacterium larrymoorei]MDQ1185397.1 cytosine/uracil/thiamine/allantoin permease [Agrobacterium larrymoorei]